MPWFAMFNSLLIGLLLPLCVSMTTEHQWIDPLDMLKFETIPNAIAPNSDQETNTFKNEKASEVTSGGKDCPVCPNRPSMNYRNNKSTLAWPFVLHNNYTNSLPVSPVDCSHCLKKYCNTTKKLRVRQDSKLYKIYVKKLVALLEPKLNHQSDYGLYQADMRLSRDDFERLKHFAKQQVNDLNAIHDIIGNMIVNIHEPVSEAPDYLPIYRNFFHRHLYMANWGLLVISSAVLAILVSKIRWDVSFASIIIKMTICSFLISVPWTWYHMYKQEEAKQASTRAQSIPKHCTSETLTVFERVALSIKSALFFNDDECAKFYENVLVDPLFKVSPTEAIAMTFVKMFITPLSLIGKEIGQFLSNTMRPFPVYLTPVPIFCLTLFLLMLFGYSFRVPWLISVEPTKRSIQANNIKMEEMDQKLSKLLAASASYAQNDYQIDSVGSTVHTRTCLQSDHRTSVCCTECLDQKQSFATHKSSRIVCNKGQNHSSESQVYHCPQTVGSDGDYYRRKSASVELYKDCNISGSLCDKSVSPHDTLLRPHDTSLRLHDTSLRPHDTTLCPHDTPHSHIPVSDKLCHLTEISCELTRKTETLTAGDTELTENPDNKNLSVISTTSQNT